VVAGTQITGLGAVTGYGWGVEALRRGLRSQRTSATTRAVDGLTVTAGFVPDEGAPDGPPAPDDRYEAAVGAAVREAVADATARGWRPGATVGVLFCTGIGDVRMVRDNYFQATERPRPGLFARMLHTSAASLVAQEHGWVGPNTVVNAACSSGSVALQLADQWVRSGVATDVVVVGAEFCVIGEVVTGFRRMRVLLGDNRSLTDCRPFQEGSRGFFLGEGALALVVSPRTDAGRARYLGGATTHDAYHLVASEPEGREMERCLVEALKGAGATPSDVGVVKAHGSGTPLHDGVEAALADRLFPPATRLVSYKPLLGHCMAVSALAELAGALAGWEEGVLPAPVTATDAAHPRLADGGPPPDGLVVCTSMGLGGTNAAVVLDIAPGGTP
jgi:3-oxoacyl-[acyl-carrier-protein] synthase II